MWWLEGFEDCVRREEEEGSGEEFEGCFGVKEGWEGGGGHFGRGDGKVVGWMNGLEDLVDG